MSMKKIALFIGSFALPLAVNAQFKVSDNSGCDFDISPSPYIELKDLSVVVFFFAFIFFLAVTIVNVAIRRKRIARSP